MIEKFAHIESLDDFLPHIKDSNYIAVSKHDNGATVICYMYSDQDSFSNIWERECRGITFSPNGKIASRGLHKFFNLNEREEYLTNKINQSDIESYDLKIDGSMIQTMSFDNKSVLAKSKKSFKSDVAILAKKYIDDNSEYTRFCLDMAKKNITPIFEYVSPFARIVVHYDNAGLILTQARHNITGEYLNVRELVNGYDIEIVKHYFPASTPLETVVRSLENLRDVEGVVVNLKSGDKFKIKTPWYLSLHHSVTFVRYRDIARLVCDQCLDDFRALVITGNYTVIDMSIIDSIEKEIFDWVNNKKTIAETVSAELKPKFTTDHGFDYRACSNYLKDNYDSMDYFFIMNIIRGKTNPYFENYKRHILKTRWGLDQIASSLLAQENALDAD